MKYKKIVDSKQIRRATVLGIIEELNRIGISRRQIARETKVSWQTIWNWQEATHAPSVKHMKSFEKFHAAQMKRAKEQKNGAIKKK